MVTLNLEIEDEKMTFKVPESWDDVSVETFSKIWGLDREGLTGIEMTVQLLSVFTGIEEDYLYMMDTETFNKVAEIVAFTNEDVKGSNVDSIMVDGEEFFVKNDFDKLTMGEVASLEILMEQAGGNIMSKMPEMLCIFLRKKKDNGKLEAFKKSFMERADKFKSISIADVNDVFLFFSNGENSSTNNMKEFLPK